MTVGGEYRVQDGQIVKGVGSGQVLTGLAGRGILVSRSPWMHEQEAAAQGICLNYQLFDFNDRGWDDGRLPQLLADCEAAGFAGLNVTFPFKQAVVPLLDDLSDAARRIGAVNTVQFLDGKRIGHNTDVSGFAESVRAGIPGDAMGSVVQIGCGGAGSATAHALLECGVGRLALFDQDAGRRQSLGETLAGLFGAGRIIADGDLASAMAAADGLVNSTPMGMANYPGLPVATALIEARHWVADIVYFPLETPLLREARQKGCRTLDGSGMAVFQAAAAFEIFTAKRADSARMLESFVQFASEPEPRIA
jgi:shikimate dehydrogenase